MPRCTILYKNKQLTIIGGGREKLCVSSVTIIYEQINYWSMPRADVANNWSARQTIILFFQTELTYCFIIQSVRFVCFVIYSILMTKNPNYTSEVSACAVNFFLLDLFAFPKSFFLSLGIYTALFLAGRGFCKIPRRSRSAFQGISVGLWNKSFIRILSS